MLLPLLTGAGLDDDVVELASTLGNAPHGSGGLLLVGTPDDEPWHFAAHLSDEARWHHRPDLDPTLVRWHIPDGAPPHLSVSLDRLEHVRRAETLFVVSPTAAPEGLLERVADARRAGALILSVHGGDRDLADLAHDAIGVPDPALAPYLDVIQHVVSKTAPDAARKQSLRDRLNQWLDTAQGLRAPGSVPKRRRVSGD